MSSPSLRQSGYLPLQLHARYAALNRMWREENEMFTLVQVLMSYARDGMFPQNMPKALRQGISRAEVKVMTVPLRTDFITKTG